MAKNSDKRAVVAKRRTELLHAIRNEYPSDQILTRVEKLRFAVTKFVKKELHRTLADEPSSLTEKWNLLTADKIIEIAQAWPESPAFKDM